MKQFKKLALAAVVAAGATLSSQPAEAEIALHPSPNGEVALVVDFDVKPGAEAEFERVFQRSATCSRLEPGNITFNVHKVIGTGRGYVLYEVWRSEDALKSHFARPYTVALFSMFDRDLTHPITDGGLNFVQDLAPLHRAEPANTDPTALAECR